MYCIWCDINRNYYLTVENACRQNCRESNDGYHEFVSFPWIYRLLDCLMRRRQVSGVREDLVEYRRQKRPNTI